MNFSGMEGAFWMAIILAGFVGWGAIEFILWLLSFISVSFN